MRGAGIGACSGADAEGGGVWIAGGETMRGAGAEETSGIGTPGAGAGASGSGFSFAGASSPGMGGGGSGGSVGREDFALKKMSGQRMAIRS